MAWSCHELLESENDPWRRSPRPTLTRMVTRMMIPAPRPRLPTTTMTPTAHSSAPLPCLPTTTTTSAAHSVPTYTALTMTGGVVVPIEFAVADDANLGAAIGYWTQTQTFQVRSVAPPTESACLDSTPRPRCARPSLVDLGPARSSHNWCLGNRTPLDQGVSEVRSTRFPLIKKSGLSTPGQSRSRAIKARWFYFRCQFPAVRLFSRC